MARCYADLRIDVRVYFDDDGENDIRDQAVDALKDRISLPDDDEECETSNIELLEVGSRAD